MSIDWKRACRTILTAVVITAIYMLILCALWGCTTTKYVPVVETHDVHHWHTDSVIQKDSTHHETQTTIMQLDSAEMARYGIQLKAAEKAWLVKTNELEFQIQQLKALSAQKDSVHDSIPVPYPVEKKVPAEISWWNATMIRLGYVLLFVIAGAIVWLIVKKKLHIE